MALLCKSYYKMAKYTYSATLYYGLLVVTLAKASSSFVSNFIYLYLTFKKVIYDKQLHKICYNLVIQ
jgi:hypothetical protein